MISKNNTAVYLKVVKKVDSKSSYHKEKDIYFLYLYGDGCLLYCSDPFTIYISCHRAAHHKLMQCYICQLYLITLKEKNKTKFLNDCTWDYLALGKVKF